MDIERMAIISMRINRLESYLKVDKIPQVLRDNIQSHIDYLKEMLLIHYLEERLRRAVMCRLLSNV